MFSKFLIPFIAKIGPRGNFWMKNFGFLVGVTRSLSHRFVSKLQRHFEKPLLSYANGYNNEFLKRFFWVFLCMMLSWIYFASLFFDIVSLHIYSPCIVSWIFGCIRSCGNLSFSVNSVCLYFLSICLFLCIDLIGVFNSSTCQPKIRK